MAAATAVAGQQRIDPLSVGVRNPRTTVRLGREQDVIFEEPDGQKSDAHHRAIATRAFSAEEQPRGYRDRHAELPQLQKPWKPPP